MSTNHTGEHSNDSMVIRVSWEGNFLVSDLTGLRYGQGDTLSEALNDWMDAVDELIEDSGVNPYGEPLSSEVERYAAFLRWPVDALAAADDESSTDSPEPKAST